MWGYEIAIVRLVNLCFGILLIRIIKEIIKLRRRSLGLTQTTFQKIEFATQGSNFFINQNAIVRAVKLDEYSRWIAKVRYGTLIFVTMLYGFVFFIDTYAYNLDEMITAFFLTIIVIVIIYIILDIITKNRIENEFLDIYDNLK